MASTNSGKEGLYMTTFTRTLPKHVYRAQ